jgi:hypothetical protein
MAMNGLILPIRIWIQWFILFGNEYIIEWICKFIYFTLIFLPYRVIHLIFKLIFHIWLNVCIVLIWNKLQANNWS